MEVTDCVGTKVEVGSVITYPGRSGSSMWMNAGVVKKIEVVERVRYWDSKPITYPVLYVERYGTEAVYEDGKRREVPSIKTSKLTRLDRITVTGLTPDELYQQLY